MGVSGVGGGGNFDQRYDVTVAKKALDAQDAKGKDAMALIESAKAPPVKPGHSLSVMA